MDFIKSFKAKVLNSTQNNFDALALELFYFQAKHNQIYKKFLECLHISPNQVQKIEEIPFLPIVFFKSHRIISHSFEAVKIFESSGTALQNTSKHYVSDLDFYHQISQKIFEQQYGKLSDYHILALLPSYLERDNSSLVDMVAYFIACTQSEYSGFYLNNTEELLEKLQYLRQKTDKKIILIGVTFALLDLAESASIDLSNIILMETGGMKGRRKEMIRAEVHCILKEKFNLAVIHSEYGMTELLSQAYSQGDELFEMPFSMKILLRDTNDPLSMTPNNKSGGINIIDLANADSCAFIATQDIGAWADESKKYFQVLGRFDNSDIRGCNLLIA